MPATYRLRTGILFRCRSIATVATTSRYAPLARWPSTGRLQKRPITKNAHCRRQPSVALAERGDGRSGTPVESRERAGRRHPAPSKRGASSAGAANDDRMTADPKPCSRLPALLAAHEPPCRFNRAGTAPSSARTVSPSASDVQPREPNVDRTNLNGGCPRSERDPR